MVNDGKDPYLNKLSTLESTYFSAYHRQVLENRRMYECNWEDLVAIEGAEQYMKFIPATAARSIDDPADHVLSMPRTKVPVRSVDRDPMKAQRAAENKRKFLEAWWSRIVSDSNPIGDSLVDALNEGRFVWRRTFDFDALPDKPAKGSDRRPYKRAMAELGKDKFLWTVEVMDNLTVFEDPGNHRDPRYIFLKYKITVEEAKEFAVEHIQHFRGMDDFSEVEYTEFWSRDIGDKPGRCMKWVEGEKVWDEENPYPYIPVIVEDSGFGTNRFGAKPHEKYRGMTEKLFPTFVAEARQMTGWEIANELSVFPMTKAWNMAKDRHLAIGPGIVTDLSGAKGDPMSEDFEFAQMPTVPVGVLQLVQKTTQMANALTKMDTLSGQPVPGVETATEAGQQINNASAKLRRIIAAYQRACVRMNRMTQMDVELVAEGPITVYGTAGEFGEVTLDPKDIDGFYENTVELRTSDADMGSMVKARFWGEMYRTVPFLSAWTAMERGEIADDPTVEMLRRAAEDVFLSPEMTMIRTITGANSFGEFATLVRGNGWQAGNTGNAEKPPGADSAGGMSAESILSPMMEATKDNALADRDVTQRVSQFKAPKDNSSGY